MTTRRTRIYEGKAKILYEASKAFKRFSNSIK